MATESVGIAFSGLLFITGNFVADVELGVLIARAPGNQPDEGSFPPDMLKRR
jgi:hypothetical protein